jgi:transposase-like protein
MSQKYGANAIGLGRVLGMALPTTWNILHKLRRVMVRSDREKLGPAVEIDESYVGGHEEGKPGRGADAKALVILAVELSSEKNRVGRIRLAKIPDASSSSLIPFIRQNVEPGSTVISDGWSGYHPVQDNGFGHIVKVMAQGKELPHVHVVFSLLKRWLPGTFQGGTSQKYLEFYMDEFVFRFNRRKSRSRGKLFGRLMEQAVATPPITRKELKVDKEPESIPQLFDG